MGRVYQLLTGLSLYFPGINFGKAFIILTASLSQAGYNALKTSILSIAPVSVILNLSITLPWM